MIVSMPRMAHLSAKRPRRIAARVSGLSIESDEGNTMRGFVTRKQTGQLLLGWLIVMAVLFLWELAERGGLLSIIGLGRLLRPLCAALFAVWLAHRHSRDTASI